jgi:hypothetical protein
MTSDDLGLLLIKLSEFRPCGIVDSQQFIQLGMQRQIVAPVGSLDKQRHTKHCQRRDCIPVERGPVEAQPQHGINRSRVRPVVGRCFRIPIKKIPLLTMTAQRGSLRPFVKVDRSPRLRRKLDQWHSGKLDVDRAESLPSGKRAPLAVGIVIPEPE